MEAVVLFTLLLVIVVKAWTIHRIHQLESDIRTTQNEEAEVNERLHNTESVLRQLEHEHKALDQELKHLENDKDLASLEVTKLGGKPITEDQLEALLAPPPPRQPPKAPPKPQTQPTQAQPADVPGDPDPDTASAPPSKQPASAPRPAQAAASSDEEAPDQTDPGKPRILVVDDNNELRGLLQQALANDYEVLDSPNGYDALTKILKEKQTYDLVITDLNMPKINGITFLENLPEGIPTIVISAFLEKPEFKQALARLKPVEILQKPFQMAALRKAIKNALPD